MGPSVAAIAICGCPVSEPNPGHCSNGRGDEFCMEEHGIAAPFCAMGACEPREPDGCVGDRPTNDCWSPCGQGQTAAQNDDCEGIADTTADPSTTMSTSTSGEPSTTEPMTSDDTVGSTTEPLPCLQQDCTDPELPLCGPEGICVPCSGVDDPGAACEAIDSTRPACDGTRCVPCTGDDIGNCGGTTPVCDASANMCVGCSFHAECPLSACRIDEGSCLDGAPVIYVDRDGPCGTGGEDDPFCTIQDAVDEVTNGSAGVIRVGQSGNSYTENVEIGDGKTIAILARAGELPVVVPAGDGPTLSIELPVTTVYVEGLRFRNNTDAHAIRIAGSTVVLDRVQSVLNAAGGLQVTTLADVTVRNSFIGADANNVDMVRVDAARLDMLYTTVLGGVGSVTPAHALACSADSTVAVRNSFLAATGDDDEIDCSVASFTTSATEMNLLMAGNVALGDLEADWYASIVGGDFHLDTPPAVLLTTAHWREGDPPVDIDGDARPTRDDTQEPAGADRPE